MRATLTYTAARVLLLAVTLGLLYLAGARGLLWIGLAVLISGLVSFIALSRQRDAMSGIVAGKFAAFRKRLDEGTRAEDDD